MHISTGKLTILFHFMGELKILTDNLISSCVTSMAMWQTRIWIIHTQKYRFFKVQNTPPITIYCFESVIKDRRHIVTNSAESFAKPSSHFTVERVNLTTVGRYTWEVHLYLTWHSTHSHICPTLRRYFHFQTFSVLDVQNMYSVNASLKCYFAVSVYADTFISWCNALKAYNPCLAQSVGHTESITSLISYLNNSPPPNLAC